MVIGLENGNQQKFNSGDKQNLTLPWRRGTTAASSASSFQMLRSNLSSATCKIGKISLAFDLRQKYHSSKIIKCQCSLGDEVGGGKSL